MAPIAVDVASNCRTGVFVSRTTAVGLEGGVLARGVAGEQKKCSVPSLHSRVPRIPNKMGRFVPTALVSLPLKDLFYAKDCKSYQKRFVNWSTCTTSKKGVYLSKFTVHPSCHLIFRIAHIRTSPQPPMQMRNPKSRTNNFQIKFGGLHGVPYSLSEA